MAAANAADPWSGVGGGSVDAGARTTRDECGGGGRCGCGRVGAGRAWMRAVGAVWGSVWEGDPLKQQFGVGDAVAEVWSGRRGWGGGGEGGGRRRGEGAGEARGGRRKRGGRGRGGGGGGGRGGGGRGGGRGAVWAGAVRGCGHALQPLKVLSFSNFGAAGGEGGPGNA